MPASPLDSARRFEALARLGQALTASLELPRVLEVIALTRALRAADRVLVQKPFTPDSLARRVRQAIDATPAIADD